MNARKNFLTKFDFDGVPFRDTYFFPAEQYHPPLLEDLAELQAERFGEVEIHFHHWMRPAGQRTEFEAYSQGFPRRFRENTGEMLTGKG